MIVSAGRRYIFVHIPKTGGTALSLALEARAMQQDILIGDTPKARARRRRLDGARARGRLWKHSTLADIDGLVAADSLKDFFIFTLVRNPWDRAVSYYHWLRDQRFDHPAVSLARRMDFSGFLNHESTRSGFQRWPAAAYLQDAAGQDRATLFARLEHLEHDLAPFEAHVGFRVTPLAPANRSDRSRDWRAYYSDADAALLARVCAVDIARFGYRFDDAARLG